jgi:PncC family amidohydrolase
LTARNKELVEFFTKRRQTLALAESCTGGLVAAAISNVPGASNALWGCFVAYTIEAKCAMLGIDRALIDRHGAVSKETARAMAAGALAKSGADWAAAVTGLAGPDGDGSGTPIGTVWIAVAGKNRTGSEGCAAEHYRFSGTREDVRKQAADAALELLLLRVLAISDS